VCQCVTCVFSTDFFGRALPVQLFCPNTVVDNSCVAEHANQSSRTGGAHGIWVGPGSGVEFCTCFGPSRCLPTVCIPSCCIFSPDQGRATATISSRFGCMELSCPALSFNHALSDKLTRIDDMLKEYDLKRDSVEINHDAPQWSHHAVWNRKYVELKPGYTLEQLWADSEPAISKKTTTSYDVQTNDVQRAVAIQRFPSPIPPDGPFLRALGTPGALKAPPQTDTLAQRALEEWERTLCENKAVVILAEIQAGRPTIIHKDRGHCIPHPGARRMAASWRWPIPQTGLCRADPAFPYLGAPCIQARCTLPMSVFLADFPYSVF